MPVQKRAEVVRAYAAIGRFVYGRYKQSAHKIVYAEKRWGTLVEPNTLACVDCGEAAQFYDHRNYDAPLVVAPVCHGCNIRRGMATLSLERVGKDLRIYWGGGEKARALVVNGPVPRNYSRAFMRAERKARMELNK